MIGHGSGKNAGEVRVRLASKKCMVRDFAWERLAVDSVCKEKGGGGALGKELVIRIPLEGEHLKLVGNDEAYLQSCAIDMLNATGFRCPMDKRPKIEIRDDVECGLDVLTRLADIETGLAQLESWVAAVESK